MPKLAIGGDFRIKGHPPQAAQTLAKRTRKAIGVI
jgi:hypothetical protein